MFLLHGKQAGATNGINKTGAFFAGSKSNSSSAVILISRSEEIKDLPTIRDVFAVCAQQYRFGARGHKYYSSYIIEIFDKSGGTPLSCTSQKITRRRQLCRLALARTYN
jgi:hypothetical protein